MAIIDRYSSYYVTSDNQFGFKKNLGCRDAIYAIRNVIELFVSKGSTVNVCAPDMSKAFDRKNPYVFQCRSAIYSYHVDVENKVINSDNINKF